MSKFIIVIILTNIIAFSQNRYFIEDCDTCKTTGTNLDYSVIFIDEFNSHTATVNIFALNWANGCRIFDYQDSLYGQNDTYSYDECNFHLLDYNSASSTFVDNESFFFEITDPNDSLSVGFLYGEPNYSDVDSLVGTELSNLNDSIDAHNASSTININNIDGGVMFHQYAYLIGFGQSDPYQSSYTASELLYAIFFDDGDNWLELILDSDRSNELVGFRYYSDRNSSTYTKFIKPNN